MIEVQYNKEGKIRCPLSNTEWHVATPEEKVRQNFVVKLVNEYGYSLDQMAQEMSTTNTNKSNGEHRGNGSARADIIVWRTPEDKKEQKTAFMVVELKAENVRIREEDYYQGFNYATWAGAKCFVTSNEKETKIFNINREYLPNKLGSEIVNIPTAEEALNDKKLDELLNKTKTFSRTEFTNILRTCHNIIRNNDKLSPEAAFDEISKILFMKIMEERNGKGLKVFTKKDYVAQSQNYEENIRPNLTTEQQNWTYMQFLFSKTKKTFAKDRLFEKSDVIKITENSFIQILEKLESYNLSDTQDDVKGIAFEKFLGTTFRGELGQFFTPRTVVDFIVSVLDPKEREIICDPCCGSGGFLIKAFEYVREKIEEDIKVTKDKLRKIIEGENFDDLSEKDKTAINKKIDAMQTKLNEDLDTSKEGSRMHYLSNRCIFGTDANPRMAHTSKMNMIMHGDGHCGVHKHDGLLNVNGIFENRFDVILTNPPFGSRVDKAQKISELDKFTDEEAIAEYKKLYGEKEYTEALNQVNNNIGEPILSLYNIGSALTECLFIERCLNLLKPGGRMGIVLPDGVLNTSNLQKVRDFVVGKAKIKLIVSLPQDVFISAGATVKSSLVFLQKFTEEEAEQYNTIVSEATEVVNAKYQPELDSIQTELAKTGRLTKEQEQNFNARLKDIKVRQNERVKALISSNTLKYQSQIANNGTIDCNDPKIQQLVNSVKEADKNIKAIASLAKDCHTFLNLLLGAGAIWLNNSLAKQDVQKLKLLLKQHIKLISEQQAEQEFKTEKSQVELERSFILLDYPTKEERKKLEARKKEIAELKEVEIKQIVKHNFNYRIPVSDIKSAGINSTGASCDNELEVLEKDFQKYKEANNLWMDNLSKMEYVLSENDVVTKINVF